MFFVNGIKFLRIISFMIETFKITIYQIGPGQGWWVSKVQSILNDQQSTQIYRLYRLNDKIQGNVDTFAPYNLYEQRTPKNE